MKEHGLLLSAPMVRAFEWIVRPAQPYDLAAIEMLRRADAGNLGFVPKQRSMPMRQWQEVQEVLFICAGTQSFGPGAY